MEVRGDLYIGEATRWALRAGAPLTGYPWNLVAVLVSIPFLVAVIMGIPFLATEYWGAPGWLYLPITVVVGAVVMIPYRRFNTGWQVKRFRQSLMERGIPNPIPVTFENTETALIMQQGLLNWSVDWAGVTDVHAVGPYWVFLAQGTPLYLPKRYFEARLDESAFLSACLDRMSPNARSRSKEAVRFVEGPPKT